MLKLVDAGDCHVDELVQQTGLAAGGRSSTSCCDSSWRVDRRNAKVGTLIQMDMDTEFPAEQP